MLKYLEGQDSFVVYCLAMEYTISTSQTSKSQGSAPDFERGHTSLNGCRRRQGLSLCKRRLEI